MEFYWTDYSHESKIIGFSSIAQKKIYYKKIGNKVWVKFLLEGISVDTEAFTLPCISTKRVEFFVKVMSDKLVFQSISKILPKTNIVKFTQESQKAIPHQKLIYGEFEYEAQ